MIPSNRRGEELEPFARDRHQFRDAGKIPIGIGDLGVADVSRERRHGVIDIGAMFVPELDTTTNESVAQVVKAHRAMAAPRGPTKVGAKLLENLTDPPLGDESARRRQK